MKALSLIVSAFVLFTPVSAQQRQAQPKKAATVTSGFKGLGFIDYYYNAQNPSPDAKGLNAFDIRRLNLGYEHSFTKNVLVYSELEANDGELTGTSKYSVFVKQAFVELKNILPQMRMVMGLSPTPAVVTSERLWGYRMLQKLPLDYYGLAPTVDNGIALKGKIDPYGLLSYHVMVANGTGTLVESNKMKRIYASLGLTPTPGFVLEGYGDFENLGDDRYRATFKGLVGYESSSFTAALEGVYRINHQTVRRNYNESPYAVSLYGWMQADNDVRFVYRGDYYDPDQNRTSGIRMIEATIGIDYMPVNDVHIVPNLIYTSYTNKRSSGLKPDDAITLRLTAGFYFSSIR
ncbi:MAG TPA: hypothetical protein VK470_03670 [Bacteroidota bacterium]|nr:hypothetical protein [Bacteroidota bacterium]